MQKLLHSSLLPSLLFALIIAGSAIRFHNYAEFQGFGWDQARDTWKVRDVLQGKWPLQGPRTGIGDFYLGAAHYYLLAPFVYFTQGDPVGVLYHNILVHLVTTVVVFWVISKLFNRPTALFALFLYSVSNYLITKNVTPWNVSYVIALSFLIYFTLVKVLQGHYRYLYLAATLTGFFFHAHFTAVFLIPIIAIVVVMAPNRIRSLRTAIFALPLFLIWLAPNIYIDFALQGSDSARISKFFSEYSHGIYGRFLLYRLDGSLEMFKRILHFEFLDIFKYLIPVVAVIYAFFKEQNQTQRLAVLLVVPWLVVPLVGWTAYSGPISDYYYLITLPAVFVSLLYLQNHLIKIHPLTVITLLSLFWLYYTFVNLDPWFARFPINGLTATKQQVQEGMRLGQTYPYIEGDIASYLYALWSEQAEPQAPSDQTSVLVVNQIRGAALGLADRDLASSLHGHIQATRSRNVQATWLWTYSALQDSSLTQTALEHLKTEEQGLFFELDPQSAQQIGVSYRGRGPWYHSDGLFLTSYETWERQLIIDAYFTKFKAVFGYYPRSVGAWWVGAQPITYMQQKYGITAVLQCADQFATDAYSLWGTPWSIAYQPSRRNAAVPAQGTYDLSKVAIVQWAPRDPLLGYGPGVPDSTYSAQDYTYKNYSADYLHHLRANFATAKGDAFVFGLESGFEPPSYEQSIGSGIDALRQFATPDTIRFQSMNDFAQSFLYDQRVLQPTRQAVYDQYQGDGQAWWYHSPHYRVLVHASPTGYRIVDLRDYQKAGDEELYNFPNNQSLIRINVPSVIDTIRFPDQSWQITDIKEPLRTVNQPHITELYAGDRKLITVTDRSLQIHTTQQPPDSIAASLVNRNDSYIFHPSPLTPINTLSTQLHLSQAGERLQGDLSAVQDWVFFRKLHMLITVFVLAVSLILILGILKILPRKVALAVIFTPAILVVMVAANHYLNRDYLYRFTPAELEVPTYLQKRQITSVTVLLSEDPQPYRFPKPFFLEAHTHQKLLASTELSFLPTRTHTQLTAPDTQAVLVTRYLGFDICDQEMSAMGFTKVLDNGTIALYRKNK